MKYSFMLRMFGTAVGGMVRQGVPDRQVRKKIKAEYRAILERAKDIGSDNKLLDSYALAAYFIAMNRCTGLTPEENIRIMESGMRSSRLLKAFMGDARGYFSEKNMESRRAWSKKTHEHRYENDWVVDVLEKTDDYQFGLDYWECGDCKLCADEGCPELAKYLCTLDFMLVDIMGITLERTGTLAEGCEKCDFRFKCKK